MFFKLEFVCWVFFDTLARVTVVGHVKNIHGVVMVFLEDATLQEKEIKKGKVCTGTTVRDLRTGVITCTKYR